MTRLVVKHIEGTKAHQVEQFPLDGFSELTIGRDPASTIAFDAQKDDLVSRRHAIIKVVREPQLSFNITDQGSANGTFVNGNKLTAESELLPGDTVQCGAGGPIFVFDVEPRPSHLVARTRQMTIESVSAAGMGATRVDAPPPPPSPMAELVAPRFGIGRETLERELGAERARSNRSWAFALAGVVLLVGLVGAVLHYVGRGTEQRVMAEVQKTHESVAAAQAAVSQKTDQKMRQDIAREWSASTVFIEAAWRLHDQDSGKPVYHRCRRQNKVCRPLYVQIDQGLFVPWLTTDDENQTNISISGAGRASGFVVSKDGHILTNKHVASGWLVEYEPRDEELKDPLIVRLNGLSSNAREASQEEWQTIVTQLSSWKPYNGGLLFRKDKAEVIRTNSFTGRSELLNVGFASSDTMVAATLIQTSPEMDVALIKIDVGETLKAVELASENYQPMLGEPVTVIGYPVLGMRTYSMVRSNEGGSSEHVRREIFEPSVTDGVIAKVGRGYVDSPVDGKATEGTLGELYQLTVLATGAGNSGGPVFNSVGQVVGLFTYDMQDPKGRGERVTFAVPIKYGVQLMKLTRVISH